MNQRNAKQYKILQDFNLEEFSDLRYRLQGCNELELSVYGKMPTRPETSVINLKLEDVQSDV